MEKKEPMHLLMKSNRWQLLLQLTTFVSVILCIAIHFLCNKFIINKKSNVIKKKIERLYITQPMSATLTNGAQI